MALTQEQITNLRNRGGTMGGGLTPQQVQNLRTRTISQPKGQIFSGGVFSDIIDVLQIPQYALTGLFSGKGVITGVKERMMPSEALGITGKPGIWDDVAGFLVDVALDPVTYIGGFGLTSSGKAASKGVAATKLLKAEKTLATAKKLGNAKKIASATKKLTTAKRVAETERLATSLAKQVEKGQKSLLSARLPFTEKAVGLVPKAIEEPLARFITRAGQSVKATQIPGLDKTIGEFASKAIGTLPDVKVGGLPAKGLGVEAIEKGAIALREQKEVIQALQRGMRTAQAKAVEELRPLAVKVEKMKKKGIIDVADEAKLHANMNHYAQKNMAKLTDAPSIVKTSPTLKREMQKIFEESKPLIEKAQKTILEVLPEQARLAEKGLTSTPTKEALKAIKKGASGESKILGREEALERFAHYFKLGDDVVNVPSGATAKAEGIISGKKYKKIKDEWFELTPDGKRMLTPLRRVAALDTEVNAARQAVGKTPIFSEKPFESLLATMTGADVAKARKLTVESLKENKNLTRKMMKGEAMPEGFREVKIKGMEGFAAEKQVADALETTYKSYSKLETVEDMLKGYTGVLNWWKRTATFVNPAFHTRNAVSNHWQMTLAGVNPRHHAKGYEVMWKASKLRKQGSKGKSFIKKMGKDYKFYQEFIDEGLGGVGQFYGDIGREIKKRNWAFEAGGAVGSFLEDSAKMSTYIAKRKAGFTAEKAGMEVRRFLFDYKDLTEFERVVMKNAFPFYTWTRKNIPLQVSALIQQPGKFSAIGKAKTAVESTATGTPMDEKLLPSWMREGYNVFLGENPEGMKQFLRLEGFLPAVDLTKISRPGEVFMEQVSPLIKSPFELFSNYSFFYEREIEQFPGEKGDVFGIPIPKKLEYAIKQIRPIKEYEKLFGLDKAEPPSIPDRLRVFFGGSYIREFDEGNQKDIYDMIKGKELGLIKKEMKKARRAGKDSKAESYADLIERIKKGELEIDL